MELHKQIISWIDSYLKENKISTLVVGVSGGVDSALVSTLCAETAWDTIVVTMPILQNLNELERAQTHINWLTSKYSNVRFIDVPLDDVFDSFEYRLQEEVYTNGYPSVAFANVRARLRMITLYHIAAVHNGIVVGTGNKIEDFGIGFFTKYGDGGVDISPIADLLKSEVREMASLLGVNPEIVNAIPTDGLYSGGIPVGAHLGLNDRTDEDQIGATYDELEWAMNNKKPEAKLSEREKTVLEIYKHRNKVNQHKMIPIPVFKRIKFHAIQNLNALELEIQNPIIKSLPRLRREPKSDRYSTYFLSLHPEKGIEINDYSSIGIFHASSKDWENKVHIESLLSRYGIKKMTFITKTGYSSELTGNLVTLTINIKDPVVKIIVE